MVDDEGGSGDSGTGDNGSNIVDLGNERVKRKKRKEKISPLSRENCYLDAMRGDFPGWAPFPTRFQIMVDPHGARSVMREEPGQVLIPVVDEAVEHALIDYSRKDPAGDGDGELQLSSPKAKEIFRIWYATQPPIPVESIAPLRPLSEPGYCWQRMPFDPTPGPTPYFDELFSRVDNAPAVMAWIGSLPVKGADREQYVWIHGDGDNGKSSLGGALEWLFGPAFRSEHPPSRENIRFWASGFIGASLVSMADCDDTKFVTSSIFKSLTGGDSMRVEIKGGAILTMKMACRFLILSNKKPQISSSVADQRRAIYAEIAPLPVGTPLIPKAEYIRRLCGEMPGFLWKCQEIWRQLAPGGGRIPATTEKTKALTEWNETEMRDFLERFFVPDISAEEYLPHNRSLTLYRERNHVLPRHIQQLARGRLGWNDIRLGDWYRWAERTHGIEHHRMKTGQRETRITGLRWSDEMKNIAKALDAELPKG